MGNVSYDDPERGEASRARRADRFERSAVAGKRDSLANQLHEIANSVEGGDSNMVAWAAQELARIRADLEQVRLTMNHVARTEAEDG